MSEQDWNPGRYARSGSFVPELGAALIDLLAPRPGERILDLGCGHGTLTQRLTTLGCTVVGGLRSAAVFRLEALARGKDMTGPAV